MSKEPDRTQRKALGKGLSTLLPLRAGSVATPVSELGLTQPSEANSFGTLQILPLDQIQRGADQPRETFDSDSLNELAQSIRANGLIQPITVFKAENEKYTIIAGERRWRAAFLADLKEIPALVRKVDRSRLLELALIENLQREDLDPIETATAFDRLITEHGLTHIQIAERTGKDRSTVTNFLRLLRLAPAVSDELVRGNLTVGHARALLNIIDVQAQQQAAQEVIDRHLSVRETERLVKRLAADALKPKTAEAKPADLPDIDPNIRAAIDEMTLALGTKVRLLPKSDGSGKLEIEYYSQDDLDRIYAVIVKTT